MTIVCLGPLANIVNELQDNKDKYKKIEEIIWYNESVNPLHGYNYEYDNEAVDILFKTGIAINVISSLNNKFVIFDQVLLNNAGRQKVLSEKNFLL